VYAALAGFVVLIHLAFVVFAVGGALLALRWLWVVWLHVPAAGWAAYIELTGGICPLTPLENGLRTRAGLDHYSGDFIGRYLFPVLYPEGLTREVQGWLGMLVLALNAGVYAFVYIDRRRAARR